MRAIFGGATIPLSRGFVEVENSENDLQRFDRYAFVDRIGIDLDRGLILLGSRARDFHGLPADAETVGIRQFLDCYREPDRRDLLRLLERLTCFEEAFHYTAQLAGPDGQFIHGFIGCAEDGGETSGERTGIVVMSRCGLVSTAPLSIASRDAAAL
jgi:hypothetical protein